MILTRRKIIIIDKNCYNGIYNKRFCYLEYKIGLKTLT